MAVLKQNTSRRGSGVITEVIKDAAFKLGIGNALRRLRAILYPGYRRDYIDNRNTRLLLAFALAEDANCIDIGAHRGTILAEFIRVAPIGRHIAYEPLPFLYEYLVDHFPSVDVRHAAVSNEEGERSFTYFKNIPGYSGFHERSHLGRQQVEKIVVRTETLDSSLPEGYIPDLIKIDVEGAERLVIEGAINTISKYKPIVLFEHGKGGADYYDTQPRDLYELLHNKAGLRIFDMDGNGPFSLRQFEETYARNGHWNFVARP